MPQRDATNDFITEIEKSQTSAFHLFKGEFDDGDLLLTDAIRPITFNSETYTGLGHFISYDSIEETAALQTTGVTISLSGVPQEMVDLVIDQDLVDKRVSIYRGYFDSSGSVIVDPILIFRGRSDGGSFVENIDDGTAIISLAVASHWVDYDKTNGRRSNHKEQLSLFPDDDFFSFVPTLVDKVITWK